MTPARFLAVDLVVRSRRSLAPLKMACPGAETIGRGMLHWTNWPSRAVRQRRSPDAAIQQLVAIVDALPRAARRCWDAATSRTFDIGIAAGESPSRPFEDVRLEPETLRAVARVEGRIQITVYPHAPDDDM